MKIVLSNATNTWWGTAEMARLLARGFRERGHEVVVFCRPGTVVCQRLQQEFPCEPILSGLELNPFALWRCRRALERHRPHVVIAHAEKDIRSTGLVASLLGIPVIMRQETDRPFKKRLRYRFFYGSLPTHHIANSRATIRTLLESGPWLRSSAVSLIPNGIEPEPFLRAEPADLGLPPEATVIGFIGRFEERKGIRELAEAWPQVATALPQAHLVIAGWGATEKEFRAWLARAPRVHWLGFRTDVPAIMKALDVLAVPSHYEGFGLVAVEAMAAGTAVVATCASSLPEIIDDGIEGRLVPARDSAALARALIEVAGDSALRAQMAEAGQARVLRDFTVEHMLDQHEALLASVVQEHGRRRAAAASAQAYP